MEFVLGPLRRLFMKSAFGMLKVGDLYRDVVERDRDTNIRPKLRADLVELLTRANEDSPFFRGKFADFLNDTQSASDDEFFAAYSRLPYFTKQDYAEAGSDVMSEAWGKNIAERELRFDQGVISLLKTMRRGDFLMPMATGGSTSLPLAVYMTKQHMFSMLFTFFKCWYRMGWRPGDKILVFYPKDTYNIDDMAEFNHLSWLSGFRIHLFDAINRDSIAGLVDDLNSYRPKMLLVFPSPLNMIAQTIREHNLPLKWHPPLINTSGETFFDCQRKNVARTFHRSKIEDSYGSVELGEIAHETSGGLEVFSNVAYFENRDIGHGQTEMIITRLGLTDFPFVRYQMKDVGDVQFRTNGDKQQFVIANIEGKDSNFILSHDSQRLYPSFFNAFVNTLNQSFDDSICEVKVVERGQKQLEIMFIVDGQPDCDAIVTAAQNYLTEKIGDQMEYDVRFVKFIEHDYRRKYRVIERLGDEEFAGGIVGNQDKLARIESSKDAKLSAPRTEQTADSATR